MITEFPPDLPDDNIDIIASRLHNQHISRPDFTTPVEVVQWLGAVQAQDYAAAKWAVGLRMKDGSDAALDRALADGAIIRTHLLRPTWHFVSPADVRWMLELTHAASMPPWPIITAGLAWTHPYSSAAIWP